MPANLNALIRYKTINSCLYGGKRKWSIDELIEKCSEALAEYRGRYDAISERTVRDDIRVMRSDILGYNAPIKQQKGLYYYSDPDYSIMSLSFTDSALIERIIQLLDKIKKEVSHPELEIILDKLRKLKGEYYMEEIQAEEIPAYSPSLMAMKHMESEGILPDASKPLKSKASRQIIYRNEESTAPGLPSMAGTEAGLFYTWREIFSSIRI